MVLKAASEMLKAKMVAKSAKMETTGSPNDNCEELKGAGGRGRNPQDIRRTPEGGSSAGLKSHTMTMMQSLQS